MSFVWCGDEMGCVTRKQRKHTCTQASSAADGGARSSRCSALSCVRLSASAAGVPLNGRSSEANPADAVAPHRLGFHYQKGAAPRRVHCLAWAGVRGSDSSADAQSGGSGAWESLEREVLVGFKSGLVELYNAQSKEMLASFDALSLTGALQAAAGAAHKPIDPSVRAPQQLNATSALVGMTVLQGGGGTAASASSSFERRLMTCSDAGVVHIRPFSTLTLDGSERPAEEEDVKPAVAAAAAAAAAAKAKKVGKKGASPSLSSAPAPAAAASVSSSGSSSFVVGSHICVLKVEPVAQSLFACGGKEHLLRLWDLPTSREIWKEKNVKHDMLNLRQQVWITDLAFVPGSAGRELVTGTAYHQVRAYDTRLECKRPIYSTDLFGDPRAVTCVDVSADTNYIIVGDSEGRLQQLDRRKNAQMVHVYKGFSGSVRSIQAHATLPLLAACGLDRKLRVYDVKTRAQVHTIYLKQKLNALLFSGETPLNKKAREDAEAAAAAAAEAAAGGDDVWLHGIKKEAGVADDDDEDPAAAATNGAGAAPGLYVKKRKTAAADDDEADVVSVERAGAGDKKQKKQKIKVKVEPVDEEETAAAAAAPAKKAASSAASAAAPAAAASSHTASFKALAPGSSKSSLQSVRGKALSQVGPAQATQIVFKQAIDFDSDEEEDDDEQDEDEDDEEGEEGENATMEDAEEEEAPKAEEPPARRLRSSPRLAPTPAPGAKRTTQRATAKKR